MPIRNPFRRAGGAEIVDENQRNAPGFENTTVAGAKPIEVKEPVEYKLSEINDSGVYLPPSPTHEKPPFWHSRSNVSVTSSNHRSMLNENEPFNISRESFDSYRRSFDISARSPISECFDQFPRQSLDARRSVDAKRSLDVRRSRAPPRSSIQEQRRPEGIDGSVSEDGFEDVGLNDEPKPAPKKRSLFARFGDNSEPTTEEPKTSSHHHFGFTGRKRAQSGGQGSELKSMSRPGTSTSKEMPVEIR